MAEKEYIERSALLEAIRFKHKPIVPTGSLADRFCKSVEETIMEQPAANVMEVDGDVNLLKEKLPPIAIWVGTDKSPIEYVPVVRCKDCKFFIPDAELDHNEYPNIIEADGLCDCSLKFTDADDFCSHGKRRDQK